MQQLEEMRSVIDRLKEASISYYKYDNPIMTDYEYDKLSERLEQLEKSTGIILEDSPLHSVQGEILESLKKVEHTIPMLSAKKTKDIGEIEDFIGDKECVLSYKADGLTIVLRYDEDGNFAQAITRGRNGIVGEDVTHTLKFCNIPKKLSRKVSLEVRGECIVSWDEFKRINNSIEIPFSHPRNLAAGSVRQLNSNNIKDRNIEFKAFELVDSSEENCSRLDIIKSFEYLADLGFTVIDHALVTRKNIHDVIETFSPQKCYYPVDGLIVKYNDYDYGKSLGTTAHHPLNMIALKWNDTLYETTLKNITYQVGKTGVLTPVAVFNKVCIDGSNVEKASLHNLSNLKKVLGTPYKGQKIKVYKANMIIPQVAEADICEPSIENKLLFPTLCPSCGEKLEIQSSNSVENLVCTNNYCVGKTLEKLEYFVSKDAMDISGLSSATLKFLLSKKWICDFKSLYGLHLYKDEWINEPGFEKKSVEKILKNIEESKQCTLDKYINSLSIPLIGNSASKDIAEFCNYDIKNFKELFIGDNIFKLLTIKGFGKVMVDSLKNWADSFFIEALSLSSVLEFTTKNKEEQILNGLSFVITGKLSLYKNRAELVEVIENYGGKVSNSISSKTNYLINNDIDSTSSKNKKAKQLGIKIISENELSKMLEIE